jgi:hypothetical protein
VVTSVINDPANVNLRLGLEIFDPTGIDYSTANYGSLTWVTNWHVNNNVYQSPSRTRPPRAAPRSPAS